MRIRLKISWKRCSLLKGLLMYVKNNRTRFPHSHFIGVAKGLTPNFGHFV